jgi:hypothetical protein
MRARRRLALVGAASAVAISLGTASVPAEPTLEGSCHGFIVSEFAHEFGGLGRAFPQEFGIPPTEIGESQRAVSETCKADRAE